MSLSDFLRRLVQRFGKSAVIGMASVFICTLAIAGFVQAATTFGGGAGVFQTGPFAAINGAVVLKSGYTSLGSSGTPIPTGYFGTLNATTATISGISTGNLAPSSNNAFDLGTPSTSWRNIYSSGTAILTNITWTNATGSTLAITGTGTTVFGGSVSTTACLVGDGSATSPSMSLASTSTGWFADKTSNPWGYGITVGGSQVMSISSTSTNLMGQASSATNKNLVFTSPNMSKNILGGIGFPATTYAGWSAISATNFGFRQFSVSNADSDASNLVGLVGATSVSAGVPITFSVLKWDGSTGGTKLNNNEKAFKFDNGLGGASTLMLMTSSGTIMGSSGVPSSTFQIISPAGTVNSGFIIGASSTANTVIAITNMVGGSASLDFGATAAGTSEDLTISVPGAVDGDICTRGVPNALASVANTDITCFVSSSNTVTVRRSCDNLVSPCTDPAAATVWVKTEHPRQ